MGKKYKPSIVYTGDGCAAASSKHDCWGDIEIHHIFYGTANHRLSEDDRLVVPLCTYHHRNSPGGIHGGNHELDLELKALAQEAYMRENNATVEDFIKRYGKNYL